MGRAEHSAEFREALENQFIFIVRRNELDLRIIYFSMYTYDQISFFRFGQRARTGKYIAISRPRASVYRATYIQLPIDANRTTDLADEIVWYLYVHRSYPRYCTGTRRGIRRQ